MRAASIAIVPDQQHGSRSGVLRFRLLYNIIAAAIFSLRGASPMPVLYHLLYNASPEVLMYMER